MTIDGPEFFKGEQVSAGVTLEVKNAQNTNQREAESQGCQNSLGLLFARKERKKKFSRRTQLSKGGGRHKRERKR